MSWIVAPGSLLACPASFNRDFQMRPSFASWGLLALLLLQGPLLQAQPLSPALQQLVDLSSQRLQQPIR